MIIRKKDLAVIWLTTVMLWLLSSPCHGAKVPVESQKKTHLRRRVKSKSSKADSSKKSKGSSVDTTARTEPKPSPTVQAAPTKTEQKATPTAQVIPPIEARTELNNDNSVVAPLMVEVPPPNEVTIDPKVDNNNMTNSTLVLYENDFETPNYSMEKFERQTSSGCPAYTGDMNIYYATNESRFIIYEKPHVVFLNHQWFNSSKTYTGSGDQQGKYAMGIKSIWGRGDKAGLVLNPNGKKYVNVKMDISTIGMSCNTGTLVSSMPTPSVLVQAYNNDELLVKGKTLDTGTMKATKGANDYTYNWQTSVTSLDVSNSKNGTVFIVWGLLYDLKYVYLALDNIVITASDEPESFPP
jgi:hypothetical protein